MKNFYHIVGSWFAGAVIVPLYYYIDNCTLFRMQNLFYFIILFSFIHFSLYFLLKLIFKDAALTSFFLYSFWGTFYLFYPITKFIKHNTTFLDFLIPYKYAILLSSFLFICLILITLFKTNKNKKISKKFLQVIDPFIFILFFLLLLQMGINIIFNNGNQGKKLPLIHDYNTIYPNIYHILLDAHPNAKATKIIGGDLIPFYQKLEKLGFITYPESKSNYPCTDCSVPSMLMLDYIPGDETAYTYQEKCNLKLKEQVFSRLSKNYSISINTSDNIVNVYYPSKFIYQHKGFHLKNEFFDFTYIIIQNTPLQQIFKLCFQKTFIDNRKQMLHNMFSSLQKASLQCSSVNHVFYYHIVCPHAPYIYDNNIQYTLASLTVDNPSCLLNLQTHKSMLANIYGIDNEVLITVQEILNQYKDKPIQPIIILHSDHSILYAGIDLKNSLITKDTVYGNLLAVYMPDEWKKDAKDLTFINLYRFIFNHLFGSHFPYLENEQIYKGEPCQLQ